MEVKFYNKTTLEDAQNQEDYLIDCDGDVYILLDNATLRECTNIGWIPAYHFATRIKELEKQVEDLKESLKCVLFEVDFAADALYGGYGDEDTDEIILARKRAE